MTIQFHYCCGKLKEVKLSPVTEKQCGMKHDAMAKKSCCDSKQVELKISSDQKTEQVKFDFSAPAMPKQETAILNLPSTAATTLIPEIFAPPPKQDPLYILHCIYRI